MDTSKIKNLIYEIEMRKDKFEKIDTTVKDKLTSAHMVFSNNTSFYLNGDELDIVSNVLKDVWEYRKSLLDDAELELRNYVAGVQ